MVFPCSFPLHRDQLWHLPGKSLDGQPKLPTPCPATNCTDVSAGSDSVTTHKALTTVLIKLEESMQWQGAAGQGFISRAIANGA